MISFNNNSNNNSFRIRTAKINFKVFKPNKTNNSFLLINIILNYNNNNISNNLMFANNIALIVRLVSIDKILCLSNKLYLKLICFRVVILIKCNIELNYNWTHTKTINCINSNNLHLWIKAYRILINNSNTMPCHIKISVIQMDHFRWLNRTNKICQQANLLHLDNLHQFHYINRQL